MIETDKYDMILLLNSYRKCVSDQRKEKKKNKDLPLFAGPVIQCIG